MVSLRRRRLIFGLKPGPDHPLPLYYENIPPRRKDIQKNEPETENDVLSNSEDGIIGNDMMGESSRGRGGGEGHGLENACTNTPTSPYVTNSASAYSRESSPVNLTLDIGTMSTPNGGSSSSTPQSTQHHPGSSPTPDFTDNHGPIPGSRDQDGRIWIFPGAKFDFEPSYGLSKVISSIIKEKFEHAWATWTEKIFTWLPENETQIRASFNHRGSCIMKNAMNMVRRGTDKGTWLSSQIRAKLQQKWDTDAFKRRSKIAKKNRASNGGSANYTGGSISIAEHRKRLDEYFQRWQDARTRASRQGSSSQDESSPTSDNTIYKKVVGGRNKKGYMYGVGHLGDEYFSSSSSQSLSTNFYSMESMRQTVSVLKKQLQGKEVRELTLQEELNKANQEILNMRVMMQHMMEHLQMCNLSLGTQPTSLFYPHSQTLPNMTRGCHSPPN
ncbi:hypothetical protein L6164_008887 [Bauhinia variegata]|uniref:Uncharacterized protein n=1 Tax=Bauhinia variegata TaxID=167791 RepID=A0ACB9PID5_BAUVA|nr:hypothetical protein L6164_008887 [Bauhinia variegata]